MAARLGNAELLRLLLKEGANPRQVPPGPSSGKGGAWILGSVLLLPVNFLERLLGQHNLMQGF